MADASAASAPHPERDRWQRVKEILALALETPTERRSALLADVCAGDAELRAEVETLLGFSDEDEAGFIERPAVAEGFALMERDATDALIGRTLGHYRLVEYVGEGGSGVVYRAVRDRADFERQVAVKILKRGVESAAARRRFRDEGRILARFDHPNIARFYDAGIAPDGRPYLVMEFLEGTPIHRHCRERQLSVRERIETFLAVCAAVEYSHRNLVIHRDLKANNILITSAGIPKLLDFGIAKLLDDEIAGGDQAEATQAAERLMTPDYASPEQILGEPITTAADVYSLGVLLFELLADARPLKMSGLSMPEMIRAVNNAALPRPSAVAPSDRRKVVQGDLDLIALKALHRSPDRRYAAPQALADDLQRYLDGRAVHARPDSPGYRLGKFIARHRTSVLLGTIGVIAIVGGTLTTVWQSAVAASREEQARRHFAEVRDLANGLLVELDSKLESVPGATEAREILARRVLRYLDGLARDQVNDSSLQRDLAVAYERLGDILGGAKASNLGDSRGALDAYSKAVALMVRVTSLEPGNFGAFRDRARAHSKYSDVLALSGEHNKALEEDHKALSIYSAWLAAMPGDSNARRAVAGAFQEIAGDLDRMGRFEEALDHRRKVLAILQELVAAQPDSVALRLQLALSYKRLGRSLLRVGLAEDARLQFLQAVEIERAEVRTNPTATNARSGLAYSLTDLGQALRARGRLAEALKAIGEGLQLRRELALADPKDWRAANLLAASRFNLGLVLIDSGRGDAARAQVAQALESRRALAQRSPGNAGARAEVAEAAGVLADLSVSSGQREQAVRLYREALAIYNELERAGSLSAEVGSEPQRVSAALQRILDQ